jgi:hypothetical protein
MRQSFENKEFVWKSADVTTMSRRAVAASILAISCVALGFIGGRLSTLIVPPTLTTAARAPLPTPLPGLASQRPGVTTPAVAESTADLPVRTPPNNPTVAIINAGSAEGNPPKNPPSKNPPSQADRKIEEPRAGQAQALPAPERRSESRLEPAQDRARDYSDLRRQMLSR